MMTAGEACARKSTWLKEADGPSEGGEVGETGRLTVVGQ